MGDGHIMAEELRLKGHLELSLKKYPEGYRGIINSGWNIYADGTTSICDFLMAVTNCVLDFYAEVAIRLEEDQTAKCAEINAEIKAAAEKLGQMEVQLMERKQV